MSLKFITGGDKIILQEVAHRHGMQYKSIVYEILSEDILEIMMPMKQNKLILLHSNEEYDMYFYCKTGVFRGLTKIIYNYKRDNLYISLVKLTGNLQKCQRRNYYRYSCLLEMESCNLKEKEIQAIESIPKQKILPSMPLKQVSIVNISGGGLCFTSEQKYEVDSLIYCTYEF